MDNRLKVLADHRDALLVAEIAAWLHMFGKLQEEFLTGRSHLARDIPKIVQTNFPSLDTLLKDNWFGSIWKPLPLGGVGPEKLTLAQLIKTHEAPIKNMHEGFRRLLIDAHGRGSGIEKGMLGRFASSHENPVYLATSLGYETLINPLDIQAAQQSLYSFLQVQLNSLKAKNARLDFDGWRDFRKKFLQTLQQHYKITVAETRRPLNDVTLLDQTRISVAFFKAALAQNLLLGKWKDPLQQKVADRYHWRLLRVGLDGLAFWGNSTRIGDLLARKGCIDDALNAVQLLLEISYPLGFEVYRDENGSIFIVPDIDDLLAYDDNSQSLGQLIQNIADEKFSGETALSCSPYRRSRDVLLFGRLASEAFPQPTPQPNWVEQQWQNKAADICSVCRLRPRGPSGKAFERKVCDVCQRRRLNRSRQWINTPSTTIWIDEVADIKGRLALLVARFDLTSWLSGSSFNTVLSINPEDQLLTDKQQGDYQFDLHTLIKDIQNGLTPGHTFEDNLLGYLINDDLRGGSDSVQDFYDLHVTHTDLGGVSSAPKPELLALSMIRQDPSFARISRVWETTKTFWEEMGSTFQKSVGVINVRLKIQGVFIPHTTSQDTLVVSHTYEIRLGNIGLSVVATKEREFLTVDNLQRVAVLLHAPEDAQQDYNAAARYLYNRLLQGEALDVEEPTGYGSPNRLRGRLRIEGAVLAQGPYLPAISLLTEPSTFMALVPSDTALNVVNAMKAKYEKEMSKVRNRLPLKVGMVFADRRTPLPAILDAGRRMLRQPITPECWKVKEVRPPYPRNSWSETVSLLLEKDEQLLSMTIATVMGDQRTEDAWYPYWCVEEDGSGARPTARKRQFTGVDDNAWVHVCDLREGDVVQFQPSRFDFEFLDTAARRFEISYGMKGKRRNLQHPARPYYLEELDSFENLWMTLSEGLETTQIDGLIGLIEEKRLEWLVDHDDEVFQYAVRDILNNANWSAQRRPKPESETWRQLYRAALRGQLADVVEVYVRMLKRQAEADKSQAEMSKTGGYMV